MTLKTSGENPAASVRDRLLRSLFRNRRRVATGFAMTVAAVLGYFAVAGDNGLTIYKQKRAQDKQLAAEIDTLKEENARLQQHVDRLKSDPEAIEHEARAKLHYARPGEVIYSLPDPPASSQAGGSSAAAAGQKR
jgi:cell division protein FtsB